MFVTPARTIGLDGCVAPFDGVVLIGVRFGEDAGSLWFALQFAGPGEPISTVECYVSEDSSFPDSDYVRSTRPVLMAAATSDDWRDLQDANQEKFLKAVLDGDFELGGNFPRYRQHLEWFLDSAKALDLPADPDEFAATHG